MLRGCPFLIYDRLGSATRTNFLPHWDGSGPRAGSGSDGPATYKIRAAPTESFQPFANSTSRYSFRSRSRARYSLFCRASALLLNNLRTSIMTKEQDQVIRYIKLRCPVCGSHRAPVRNTKLPAGGYRIRYYKCSGCGLNFKSVEQTSK